MTIPVLLVAAEDEAALLQGGSLLSLLESGVAAGTLLYCISILDLFCRGAPSSRYKRKRCCCWHTVVLVYIYMALLQGGSLLSLESGEAAGTLLY